MHSGLEVVLEWSVALCLRSIKWSHFLRCSLPSRGTCLLLLYNCVSFYDAILERRVATLFYGQDMEEKNRSEMTGYFVLWPRRGGEK